MFVRKKTTSSGTIKHYLVESQRIGGKVRQKVLFYLGDHASAEVALTWLDGQVANCRQTALSLRRKVGDYLRGVEPADAKEAIHLLITGRDSDVRSLACHFDNKAAFYEAEATRLREVIRSAQS